MSHFYPLTSVSQTGYEVIDENMDGPQPAGSPANLLLSLVSRLPAHFPVIHQPPGDNGSKITNYLLQWDEVRVAPDVQPVALMLLFKLLRPISPPPPPYIIWCFLSAGKEEQRLQRMLLREPETL